MTKWSVPSLFGRTPRGLSYIVFRPERGPTERVLRIRFWRAEMHLHVWWRA